MPTTGNCSYDDVNVAVMKEACARQNRCMLPLQFPAYSYRTYVIAAAAVASLVFGVLVAYGMPRQEVSSAGAVQSAQSAGKGVVYLSPSEKAAALAVAPERAPMMEFHIANNGLALLRGARVVSVSGNIIRVAMEWGSTSFTWSVITQYNTQYLNAKGEKAALSDIQAGDILTVTGTLNTGGTENEVLAQYIRE